MTELDDDLALASAIANDELVIPEERCIEHGLFDCQLCVEGGLDE